MTVKWSYNDAMASAKGQFRAVSELGLKLIAVSSLAYLRGVYWAEDKANKRSAKETRDEIMALCETQGYKKGAQYDYAQLSYLMAVHMAKAWGTGAGKEINQNWQLVFDCETVDQAADLIIAHMRDEMDAVTVRDLREALTKPAKAKAEVSFSDATIKKARKLWDAGELQESEIKAVIAALEQMLDPLLAMPAPLQLAA